ncbi:MAG: 3-deoxy-D-manno-octulosonic acid transferase [Hyphomonadaceae bacterium]|nr:3-deoxy-D-manno-octulosonic acid transferase [Hyphomonadaceae bacterium]
MTAALGLYRAALAVLAPFAAPILRRRARAGLEDPARLQERFGHASQTRPAGSLVWLHAASVGEMGVALQLRDGLAERRGDLSFLVTTGTRTSAQLFASRRPAALHQYAPIDRRDAVRRFLAHWRPDLGVFIESELWPNLALEAEARGVALALVNARMSEGALRRWRSFRASAARLLKPFDPIFAADARTSEGLAGIIGRAAPALGNLKLAAAAPPADAAALAALRAEIGPRPIWLAASTHPGEDEIVLAAHREIVAARPDALLILAPRHPERGAEIAALAGAAPRRSVGAVVGPSPVYVADTMGEMGLFYRLAAVSLVCGSLLPTLRGHNPIEPAKLGSAILAGPHVSSFGDLFEALDGAGGIGRAGTADEIAAAVLGLWRDEALRERRTRAAAAAAEEGGPALAATLDALLARLPPSPTRTHAAA